MDLASTSERARRGGRDTRRSRIIDIKRPQRQQQQQQLWALRVVSRTVSV